MKLNKGYVKNLIPKRDSKGHKGTFGSALLVTGSYSMAGAGILSAKAASRTGCGIVKHVLPHSIYSIVASNVVESVYIPLEDSVDGNIDAKYSDYILSKINNSNSALIGCGLKNNRHTFDIVSNAVLNSNVPVVIDADGINSLVNSIDILKKSKAPIVLTPHLKEFSRISNLSLQEISSDPIMVSTAFSKKYGCVLVLKSHETVIASPNGEFRVNTTGNSGMAKGGSGDVLAGMIASFLAQGINAFDASSMSVFIHGLAGDIAAQKKTEYSMTAMDIIDCLGDAFQKLV